MKFEAKIQSPEKLYYWNRTVEEIKKDEKPGCLTG